MILPPSAAAHVRQIEPRKPRPGEHIHFEEPPPVGVGDLLEGLHFVDSEIVHQNVHGGISADQILCDRCRAQVACKSHHRPAGRGPDRRDCTIDRLGGAAVDDHTRPFARERGRDRMSDAGGAAGYQRHFVAQFEIHEITPLIQFANDSIACMSTLAPVSRCAGAALSASLWLKPPAQGTKIIEVGTTDAVLQES